MQEGITQTYPLPNQSTPDQHMRFAPQNPAINHAAVNKDQFAQFSPTSSTPERTSSYPTSYVPYKYPYPYRDTYDSSYVPHVQHSPFHNHTQTSRPPDRASHFTMNFDTTNNQSSGRSVNTTLGSPENAKPRQEFQLPKRSKPIKIVNPTTKEEWLPAQLVPPVPASAATPNLDAHAPREELHNPASPDLPLVSGVVDKTLDRDAFWADMGPRIARLRAHEATRANAKQQAEATKSSKEVAEQNPAISPSLSQKEAATSQSTGATASIAPLAGVENVEHTLHTQFKKFAEFEKQKFSNQRKAQQAQDRMAKLNDLQRFAESFKLKTPVPPDLVGILATDPGKQAQIINKARRSVEEENSAIASSKPVGDKTSWTEAFNALMPHHHIEERRDASIDQQVSAQDTVRERPVVRMPLPDQFNPEQGITQRQMLDVTHLDSLRTQTLEALTANGQDPTTHQSKSVSKPSKHRPRTWAELSANYPVDGKQAPTTDQRNSISEPRKEAPSVDGADIVSIQYIDQKPKPRRRRKKQKRLI